MSEGISIHARAPRLLGAGLLDIYTDRAISYTHTIDALGGYKSADFMLVGEQDELEDWFENGLLREIVVYDEAGAVVWEGFVNSVALMLGGRAVERGPVLDMANRVRMVYSTIDTTVTPPVTGMRVRGAYVNEADSQARYGILTEIFSTSGVSQSNADDLRDAFLAEMAWPETSESLSLTPTQSSVTVHCVGYGELLKKAVYNSTTTGSGTLTSKLTAAVSAEPNGWIVVDAANIAANALSVPLYDDNDRRALDVIKGLVAMGDASSNRYLFGVYAGRQAYYQQAPSAYAYEYSINENELRTYGGETIAPWNVLPGRWLYYPDFLVGYNAPSLRRDPRSVFIESVTYTAPMGITITGGKVSKLSQKLARLGLGGA